MQPETVFILLDLNRQFYQTFARSFADTRRRIQPGVRRVLGTLPPGGRWLDLGCGSGALAEEWIRAGRTGLYHGLDFSPGLLDEARQTAARLPHPGLEIRFSLVDLSHPEWAQEPDLEPPYDGVLAFAALHHLPSAALRLQILRQVSRLLAPGGYFIHSEWQFHNSPRLLARVLPWENAGISAAELEAGDTLLDWRAPQADRPTTPALRYVHRFGPGELENLAQAAGFTIQETFESDGEGGRLGLYQIWKKDETTMHSKGAKNSFF